MLFVFECTHGLLNRASCTLRLFNGVSCTHGQLNGSSCTRGLLNGASCTRDLFNGVSCTDGRLTGASCKHSVFGGILCLDSVCIIEMWSGRKVIKCEGSAGEGGVCSSFMEGVTVLWRV